MLRCWYRHRDKLRKLRAYSMKMALIWDFVNGTIKRITDFISWVMSRCTSVVMKVMVVVLVLLVAFWLSLFFHLFLMQILVPTKTFSWPAYLELDPDFHHLSSGNLTAVVPLAASPSSDSHCIFPPSHRSKKTGGSAPVCMGGTAEGPPLLKRGQRYSVVVDLELPDSRPNRHHPMFQVQITMLDSKFGGISVSRRPLLVPYRSKVQRVAAALLQVPTLLLVPSFLESHSLSTTVYDNYVDDPQRPARFVRLELLRTINLQVTSAYVHVHASLSGLQYTLHQHPLLCAVVGTLVNMTLLLAAVSVIYFRRVENALERQRQRKPVRHADPQQELRSPKTASRRGDPSEPRPLCDVDEELKARRQTEDLLLEASVSAAKDGASKGRPEKKKRTSLKKKDSFRVKKACSPVETSQFFEDEKNEREKKGEEEEVFSSEKESVLEEKKVSVLDGATPTVFKKEGSPQVVESSVEENYSSSVHGKFSSLEVNETNEKMGLACEKSSFADDNKESSFADDNKENSFADDNKENSSADDNMNSSADDNKENSSADDTKENSFAADNKNSFADDNKENSFADNNTEKGSMEQRCTSESSVRKRVVREDPVDNMEVGAKLSKLGDKEACEAGAWQLDRSPVKDCGVSSTEVKKVDCALSPTEVQKVDCGLSPPASPVSTGSSDSQSSLGDFTMVQ